MNLNGKRTLLVAIALSTFFAAALSFGARNRWNARMVTITPDRSATETKPIDVPTSDDKLIPCRTALLTVPTHFEVEAKWVSGGSSSIAVPYLKNGGTAKLECMKTVPLLITQYNDEIKRGDINVKCVNGALKVTSADCAGLTKDERDKIEADRQKEEQRLADEAAAAEAARIAAEQAAAAAAAAAAAPCPQNCNGGTGRNTFGSSGKNGNQYTVSWQACNSGHKIVRSSGRPSTYAVGACYNSIPK